MNYCVGFTCGYKSFLPSPDTIMGQWQWSEILPVWSSDFIIQTSEQNHAFSGVRAPMPMSRSSTFFRFLPRASSILASAHAPESEPQRCGTFGQPVVSTGFGTAWVRVNDSSTAGPVGPGIDGCFLFPWRFHGTSDLGCGRGLGLWVGHEMMEAYIIILHQN